MRVLTIQSKLLDVNGRVYPDPYKCNHPNAFGVYQRLFGDYNNAKGTNCRSFFWGFSELLTDDIETQIKRAREMIGASREDQILILEVPDEICLETDFYNFADEIYAAEFPDELESIWESIYQLNAERQVIFPYIDQAMIKERYNYEYR